MNINDYLHKYKSKKLKVGIVGLGYVGLPLLWSFHQSGVSVLGFDIDPHKINYFRSGKSYLKHLGPELMKVLSNSNKADATIDFKRIAEVDTIILCVPTPLNHNREPDMSYIESTAKSISKYLKKGHLIILESTTWPGTTEELLVPILEAGSGLKVGNDFYVAYSPEREDPGNKNFSTSSIPKVVGGYDSNSLKLALTLYELAISKTVPVSDCRTAEASKLTENIFRAVNIAMVNELKVVYDAMNIDVNEVLNAAATKPFGFMKFTPGPGLGGHCIPIDPFYLTWKAREFELNTRFIELAGEINTFMPYYVVEKLTKLLNDNKKSVNGTKVLIIGLAYKPDIDDIRESPSLKILHILNKMGAEISYYDPYISKIPQTREYSEYEGIESITWKEEIVAAHHVSMILTNHSCINYEELVNWSNLIIDTRNTITNDIDIKNKVIKS